MLIGADAAALQLRDELVDGRAVFVAGDDDAVDGQFVFAERIDQAHDLQIVRDAVVRPRLVGDDVAGVDRDDDLGVVLHAGQQLDLRVFVESGQHSRRVLVVDQFAAEFQIQPLAGVSVDPLQDVFRLLFQILFRIKPDVHDFPSNTKMWYLYSIIVYHIL